MLEEECARSTSHRHLGSAELFPGAAGELLPALEATLRNATLIGFPGPFGAQLMAKRWANPRPAAGIVAVHRYLGRFATELDLATTFRGYDLRSIDYTIREFTCHGCTNYCDIQEFTVEGNRTFWGDKCSDRYRKRAKVPKKPVTADLVKQNIGFQPHAGTETAAPAAGYHTQMEYYEKLVIRQALEAADFNISRAARGLALGRSHLHKKIKALNIGTK